MFNAGYILEGVGDDVQVFPVEEETKTRYSQALIALYVCSIVNSG